MERLARPRRSGGFARVLAALIVMIAAVANADQFGDFSYATNNGSVAITGYTGPGGAVMIPETINGLPGTNIAAYAFSSSTTNPTDITVSSNVTSISSYAFSGFAGLTHITLGSGVTSVGSSAFYLCTNLMAIGVDDRNAGYSSMGGVLFDKAQSTLEVYPGGRIETYAVPSGVATRRQAQLDQSEKEITLASASAGFGIPIV